MNTELIVFIVYIVFVVAIGVYFFLKGQNASDKDYFLGGRRMGAWVAVVALLIASGPGAVCGLIAAVIVTLAKPETDPAVHALFEKALTSED